MSLDLLKPLRMKNGDPVKVIAFFGTDEAAERYRQQARGHRARMPGQTLLIEHKGEVYGWYHPDGRYAGYPSSVVDLENYTPPVVVKTQRRVRINDAGVVHATVSLGVAERDDTIVEFTVIDGKLTNVEIVE